MKVKALSDYLTLNSPCLHISEAEGTSLSIMRDVDSVIVTVKYEKLMEGELDYLMNAPIEFGIYEKNHHCLPVFAMNTETENSTESADPYIWVLPFDPVYSSNQPIIDYWVGSKFMVVCFVENDETGTPVFRGIRIIGTTDEMIKYLGEYWVWATEQGSRYSTKYWNFVRTTTDNMDALEIWNKSKKFGQFDE